VHFAHFEQNPLWHVGSAGRRHRRRVGAHRDCGKCDPQRGTAVSARLADLATNDERSALFGAGNAGVIARDGQLFRRDDESRSEAYPDILARAGLAEIEARGMGRADTAAQAEHAHGAVFAEVKVDPELGQIRATRMVGAFAAGRIINPHLGASCSAA